MGTLSRNEVVGVGDSSVFVKLNVLAARSYPRVALDSPLEEAVILRIPHLAARMQKKNHAKWSNKQKECLLGIKSETQYSSLYTLTNWADLLSRIESTHNHIY